MNAHPFFAAVILAAGASRRMGTPKAFLEYRGERFVDRLVRIFHLACEQVVVVRSAACGKWRSDPAEMVENPHPERGMLSSLQCGLRAVAPEADAVFFTPVDYPAISETTVSKMARAWNADIDLILPRSGGRRGHPVLISRRLAPELLALPESAQARDVIRSRESAIYYVDVDDPGILHDIDYPEEYRALTAEQP